MNISVGDVVKILEGKHKGKTALVKEAGKLQVCCFIDNSFYIWFYPNSLKFQECVDTDWGGNGDYTG